MRSINNQTAGHNDPEAGRPFGRTRILPTMTILVLLVLLISGSGCGEGEETTAARDGADHEVRATAHQADPEQADPIRIDDRGWRSFQSMGARIHSDEELSVEDLSTLADGEVYRFWRRCLAPQEPDAMRVGRWLEAAFWDELGRSGPKKESSNRRAMTASYRYSYQHSDTVDLQIQEWRDLEFQEKFLTRTRQWVDQVNLPDPLTLHFLPTWPELRYCSDEVLVDTGVLVASGNRQLRGQMIALLYRNLQSMQVDNDENRTPEASVAHAFLMCLDEGIPAWVEDSANTYFRQDHKALKNISPVREAFYLQGIRTIDFMNEQLPEYFSNPETMDRRGPNFVSDAGGRAALTQVGYVMIATIIHHLGEDRMLEVRKSVPQFLIAYQEAALLNPDPRPTPGDPNTPLPETMPALDPDVFEQVRRLLFKEYSR